MRTRYGPSRCCCPSDTEVNPCPCLSGTFNPGGAITLSGFTMIDIGSEDINDVYAMGQDAIFQIGCAYAGFDGDSDPANGYDHWVHLKYTQLKAINGSPLFDFPIVLPAGTKAVVMIYGAKSHFPDPPTQTAAVFHKVLADVNGFVDCRASLTGFTFNDQDNGIDDFGTPFASNFDASGGSISYS